MKPPFDFAVEDYPLAPLTLYKIGGPADLALLPRNVAEARTAYEWLLEQPGRKIVLGGGSNVLIDDRGIRGIVLVTTHFNSIDSLGGGRYHIEAGTILDRVVQDVMLANNYAGVGGLTGIPGTVGGAIYMNAGTVNGSTCQHMESVEIIDSEGCRVVPIDESRYSYRGQDFCSSGGLILRGLFHFEKTDEPQRPIYDHYIQRRREKQPKGNCCGSVFKNPPGDHAGRLIESCALKGTRRGGAQISPMHANFIMNDDKATFDDIRGLIALCRATVQERHGVTLETEVVIVRAAEDAAPTAAPQFL
ncbi:MAG: UDP-N-acetylmuramate dehydrogenase [Candidatus Hydrogenedentes bacterium]|nr:UDP-N-acetylmuramate dehydrogenase [Candidatus Hydrogenedentota bacterium]